MESSSNPCTCSPLDEDGVEVIEPPSNPRPPKCAVPVRSGPPRRARKRPAPSLASSLSNAFASFVEACAETFSPHQPRKKRCWPPGRLAPREPERLRVPSRAWRTSPPPPPPPPSSSSSSSPSSTSSSSSWVFPPTPQTSPPVSSRTHSTFPDHFFSANGNQPRTRSPPLLPSPPANPFLPLKLPFTLPFPSPTTLLSACAGGAKETEDAEGGRSADPGLSFDPADDGYGGFQQVKQALQGARFADFRVGRRLGSSSRVPGRHYGANGMVVEATSCRAPGRRFALKVLYNYDLGRSAGPPGSASTSASTSGGVGAHPPPHATATAVHAAGLRPNEALEAAVASDGGKEIRRVLEFFRSEYALQMDPSLRHRCIVPALHAFVDILPRDLRAGLAADVINFRTLAVVLPRCLGSLRDLAARKRDRKSPPWTLSQLVRVADDMLDAVAHLFTRGIVHRDIKLENWLIHMPPSSSGTPGRGDVGSGYGTIGRVPGQVSRSTAWTDLGDFDRGMTVCLTDFGEAVDLRARRQHHHSPPAQSKKAEETEPEPSGEGAGVRRAADGLGRGGHVGRCTASSPRVEDAAHNAVLGSVGSETEPAAVRGTTTSRAAWTTTRGQGKESLSRGDAEDPVIFMPLSMPLPPGCRKWGTPCWMPPEVAAAKEGVAGEQVDYSRADLFAAGICLWQLVAGAVDSHPHDATLRSLALRLRKADRSPEASQQLLMLIGDMVSEDPRERPSPPVASAVAKDIAASFQRDLSEGENNPCSPPRGSGAQVTRITGRPSLAPASSSPSFCSFPIPLDTREEG